MLQLMQANNCHKIFNDNSAVIGNWSEASKPGKDEWFPAMASAGLKYFAWVLSPEIFSQFSAVNSVNNVIPGLQVQLFLNRTDAAEWLEKFNH